MIATEQNLSKMNLAELFDAASSTEPTPGGGCVSAVCGYLAIGLLIKSIRISARKQGSDAYSDVERRLLDFSSKLLLLARADSDSFGVFMQALRLPKDTPSQLTVRKEALNAAAIKATEAALNILDLGNGVLDLAHQVQFRVLTTIRADEKSCIELISAMNTTAQENALANLAGVEHNELLNKRLADATQKHATLLAACRSA